MMSNAASFISSPSSSSASSSSAVAIREASTCTANVRAAHRPPGNADDFLSRVAAVCRLRGREGLELERFEHEGRAYLRVVAEEDGQIRTYPIAAEAASPDASQLEAFLQVHRAYRDLDPQTTSVFVYGGGPADESLVGAAAREGVRLQSFVEFQGRLDLRPWGATLLRRLGDEPFSPSADAALDDLFAGVDGPDGGVCLVLGPADNGKSALLRAAARRFVEASPWTPILIEAGRIATLEGDVAQRLAAVLAHDLETRIDVDALRRVLHDGHVVFLLDDLDLLARPMSWSRAIEPLTMLNSLMQGRARAVLACREQHFAEVDEPAGALREVFPGASIRILRTSSSGAGTPDPEERLRREGERGVSTLDRLGTKALRDAALRLAVRVFREDLPGLRRADLEIEAERLSMHALAPESLVYLLAMGLLLRREGDLFRFPDDMQEHFAARAVADELVRDGGSKLLRVRELPPRLIRLVAGFAGPPAESWARDVLCGPYRAVARANALRLLGREPKKQDEARATDREAARPWVSSSSPGLSLAWRCGRLVTSHENGRLRFWDASAGCEITRFSGSSAAIECTAWNADASVVAAGSRDGIVRLWNVETGVEILRLEGHKGSVEATAWSDDGRILASASQDGTVRLWNPEDGTQIATAHHGDAVVALSWHPRKRLLASASHDRIIRLWDEEGDARGVLEGHRMAVTALAWSPDGKTLASTSYDRTIRLWDVEKDIDREDGEGVLRDLESMLTSLSWHPNGAYLAAGSSAGTLWVWDLSTAETEIEELRRAVAEDIYETTSRRVTRADVKALEGHEKPVTGLAWSSDGARLASVSRGGAVRLWDADAGKQILRLAGDRLPVLCGAWGAAGSVATGTKQGEVRLWDPRGTGAAPVAGRGGAVRAAAWNPSGERLAAVSDDGGVRLWSLHGSPGESRLELDHRLEGHGKAALAAAWSGDGRTLASASRDRSIRLWAVPVDPRDAPEPGRILHGHGAAVTCLSWRRKTTTLASGSYDASVRLWETSVRTPSRNLEGHEGAITALAWSGDGMTLASGSRDASIRLWRASTSLSRVLIGHEEAVLGVAWNPQARRLASASEDQTVRLWNLDSRGGEVVLTGHEDAVLWVSWSPDGRFVVSGSRDNTMRLWDAGEQRCVRIFAQLPRGEWAVYAPNGRFCFSREALAEEGWANFWYSAGLRRYEPGEIDLGDHEPDDHLNE